MRRELLTAILLVMCCSVFGEDTLVVAVRRPDDVRAHLLRAASADELRDAFSEAREVRGKALLPDLKRVLEKHPASTLPVAVRSEAYAALAECGDEAIPLLLRMAESERELDLLRELGRRLAEINAAKSATAIGAAIARGDLPDSRVQHLVILWGALGKPGIAAMYDYLKTRVTTREILEHVSSAAAQQLAQKTEGAEELARVLERNGCAVRIAQRDQFPVPENATAPNAVASSETSATSTGDYATAPAATALPAIDLMLLVDASSSIMHDWEKMQKLVTRSVQALQGKTSSLRIGWIYVGAITANIDVHPFSYAAGNCAQIFAATPVGTSGNTTNCLNAVLDSCIFRRNARRIVLLIGDDGTIANKETAAAVAKRFHDEAGGKLFAIVKPGASHSDVSVDILCKATGGELVHSIGAEGKKDRLDFTPNWDEWLKEEH